MILESLRKIGYITHDLAHGGLVSNHLADLRRQYANEDLLDITRKGRLASILRHASNVPYYTPYAGKELSAFPVVQKLTIKKHRDQFLWKEASRAGLSTVSTSGSSGTSVLFDMTGEKLARRRAEIIYFNSLAGFELGMPYAVINAQTTSNKKKTSWTRLIQNEIHIAVASLAETDIRCAITTLMKANVKIIVAWPSVLRELSRLALDENTPIRGVRTIITMGEALLPETRAVIEQFFGCPVVNRYSTYETGVLAFQHQVGGALAVNQASYVVELLGLHDDRPVALGEQGRVVVTDLYSHAMPLIRYDIGDLAVAQRETEYGVAEIQSVDGRYVETIFDTKGNRILPMRLLGALHKGRSIRRTLQYQFIQEGQKEYCINAVSTEAVLAEELISGALREALGEDALIRYNYVPSIAALPSGKRPLIINKWFGQAR